MSLYKCYRQGARQSDSFGQSYDKKSQGRVVIIMSMARANLKGVLNYYSLLIHAFSGGGKGSSLRVPGSLHAYHSLHHLLILVIHKTNFVRNYFYHILNL